ncbi:MAG: EamA family transporter [Chloroflexi bacterium]|nr:EamA family transporter [Chloroflexota bacterium]
MFAWTILSLLGAIWGASYLFIKIGGAEIPAFTFVAGRTLIAAVALVLVIVLRKERVHGSRELWLSLAAMGLFNGAIPYTAITWGETHISSGLAAILTAAMPLFTVILAHFWTHDERLTPSKLAGIAVGFLGVIILFAPELRQGVQIEFWGELAIIIAAASYAIATLIARRQLRGVSHAVAATGQLASAALMMIPLSLLFDQPWSLRPSLTAIGSLVILALLGTSFAYILYYWLIEHTGATRTALVTYLIPITGVLWGALLLSEPVEAEAIIGLLLIISGVGLVNRRSGQVQSAAVAAPVEGD